MRAQSAFLVLCFGVVGLLAAPDRTFKSASAAGFGPGGYQYQTDPNGVFISGPGYYAGATTFNGVPPNFNLPAFNFPSFNFPAFNFPTYPNFFGGPGTYAPQYPFNLASMFQSYLNTLAQNTASFAAGAKPPRFPTKYSSTPKGHSSSSSSSASFAFPQFPEQPPNPFFPPLQPLQPIQPIDFSLGNRFGEEGGTSVGSSVSSSSTFESNQPGGVSGTFSSSVHGSTNVNGKEENFHVSTTGVHENGKVTSVTVHKP